MPSRANQNRRRTVCIPLVLSVVPNLPQGQAGYIHTVRTAPSFRVHTARTMVGRKQCVRVEGPPRPSASRVAAHTQTQPYFPSAFKPKVCRLVLIACCDRPASRSITLKQTPSSPSLPPSTMAMHERAGDGDQLAKACLTTSSVRPRSTIRRAPFVPYPASSMGIVALSSCLFLC